MVRSWEVKPMSMFLLSPMPRLGQRDKWIHLLILDVLLLLILRLIDRYVKTFTFMLNKYFS